MPKLLRECKGFKLYRKRKFKANKSVVYLTCDTKNSLNNKMMAQMKVEIMVPRIRTFKNLNNKVKRKGTVQ